jgi:hypothetical protein
MQLALLMEISERSSIQSRAHLPKNVINCSGMRLNVVLVANKKIHLA